MPLHLHGHKVLMKSTIRLMSTASPAQQLFYNHDDYSSLSYFSSKIWPFLHLLVRIFPLCGACHPCCMHSPHTFLKKVLTIIFSMLVFFSIRFITPLLGMYILMALIQFFMLDAPRFQKIFFSRDRCLLSSLYFLLNCLHFLHLGHHRRFFLKCAKDCYV